MKALVCQTAILAALLVAMAPAAAAAERTLWVGRDVDNTAVHWTCTNTTGDDWILKKNGRIWDKYEEVARTAVYVELQAKGTRNVDRVRLYKDKLSMNKNGSKFQFVTVANGKWSN